MKQINDNSIDLVLIDPPYFKVKSEDWDNQWNDTSKFLEWLELVIVEIYRISKPSTSFYCFCYPKLSFEVENIIRKYFNVINHIVWEKYNDKGFDGWKQKCSKDSLRKFYPNSERIIFSEKCSFGSILKSARLERGLSTIKLAELTGFYGKVNHGGSISNWESNLNTPNAEQYKELQKYIKLPDMNYCIRPFNAKSDIQYTDVLRYKTVKPYKGKHPCENPNYLLEHLISISSNENDIVFDCFAGSGSTLLAAKKLNRKYIGIEKDLVYYTDILNKLN